MKKLYIVRHMVEAESIKQALKLAKSHQPDECYLAEEWMTKVGFLRVTDGLKEVKGFRTK